MFRDFIVDLADCKTVEDTGKITGRFFKAFCEHDLTKSEYLALTRITCRVRELLLDDEMTRRAHERAAELNN